MDDVLPTWLVFAGQIYVDIHNVLRTKSTQPFADLYDFAVEARRVLRGYENLQRKRPLVGYQSDDSVSDIKWTHQQLEKWIFKDEMLNIMNKNMGPEIQAGQNLKTGALKVRTWKQWEIMNMDPLLSGMWLYSYQLEMSVRGLRLVNETQVMVAAHLYNALQQNGYLPADCVWEDAEYLLHIHRASNTFLGSRPVSIEDCTKRLALAQGVSAQTFAADRRPGQRIVLSKTGGKSLQRSTPLAGIFIDRFLERGPAELSLASIEEILNLRLKAQQRNRSQEWKYAREIRKLQEQGVSIETHEGYNMLRKAVGQNAVSEADWIATKDERKRFLKVVVSPWDTTKTTENIQGADNLGTSKAGVDRDDDDDDDTASLLDSLDHEDEVLDRWEKTHKLGLTDFLEELGKALNDESLDLQFDYISFHRQTRMLLEKIHTACMPIALPQVREPMTSMLESAEGPLLMPGLIMSMACNPAKAPNLLALKHDVWVVDDRGLKAAAEVMREFIVREGSSYSSREEKRLQMQMQMGQKIHGDDWEEEVALAAENFNVPGTVGQAAGMSAKESADKYKAMTIDDAIRRYNEKQRAKGEKEISMALAESNDD